MALKPDITLWSLEASRSIRIAWLMEELNLPYKLVSSPRTPSGFAPSEFRDQIGTFLGKSPTLMDNGVVIQESGAIAEYLCENYDSQHRMLPQSRKHRAKVREFIAASEGTMLMHAMPIFFGRWKIGEEHKQVRESFETGPAAAVQKDLDWLELELAQNAKESPGSRFLVGSTLTAADVMMAMSVQSIFARQLGTQNLVGSGRWKGIEDWLIGLEALESYKLAWKKTNYGLPDFKASQTKI